MDVYGQEQQKQGNQLSPGARRILLSLGIILIVGGIVVGAMFASGYIKLPEKDGKGRTCEQDQGCKAGEKCGEVDGKKVCVTGCTANANCNEGQVCYGGVCGEVELECNLDADCAEGNKCVANKCEPLTCTDTCTDPGFECVNGTCLPIPNDTCLQGRECPPDRPVCQPSPEDASIGVCLPDPTPTCETDACTALGPNFFCNENNVCVELPPGTTPDYTPSAAVDGSGDLDTVQIGFIVIAALAGLFTIFEAYQLLRTSIYLGSVFGKGRRGTEGFRGAAFSILFNVIGFIATGLIIGFRANNAFLAIPLIFFIAAVAILLFFRFERYQAPYERESDEGVEILESIEKDVVDVAGNLDSYANVLSSGETASLTKADYIKMAKLASYVQALSVYYKEVGALTETGGFADSLKEAEDVNGFLITKIEAQNDGVATDLPKGIDQDVIGAAYLKGAAYAGAVTQLAQSDYLSEARLDRFSSALNDSSAKPDKLTQDYETYVENTATQGDDTLPNWGTVIEQNQRAEFVNLAKDDAGGYAVAGLYRKSRNKRDAKSKEKKAERRKTERKKADEEIALYSAYAEELDRPANLQNQSKIAGLEQEIVAQGKPRAGTKRFLKADPELRKTVTKPLAKAKREGSVSMKTSLKKRFNRTKEAQAEK